MSPSATRALSAAALRFSVLATMLATFLAWTPTPSRAQFDGLWTRLDHQASFPPGRRAAGSAYDSQRHRLIVFGGYPEYLNDVWALDLATELWQQLTPSGSPPSARYGATAIYDAANDRLIVFGGFDGIVQNNDVWELSLSGSPAWTRLSPSGTLPTRRSFHVAAYDAPRQRMILFGGWDGAGFLGDTWELSLSGSPAWSAMTFTDPTPAARNLAGVAVDLTRARLVLFGGWSGVYRNDTWTLPLAGPSEWSELATAHRPSPRREVSIAYDAANDRIVSFGGNNGTPRSDTWVLPFAGTPDWLATSANGNPPGRFGHSTIYEPVTERVIVFGGFDGVSSLYSGHSNRVWALSDGPNEWNEIALPTNHPKVRNYSLVRDPVANSLLLFGGEIPDFPSLSNDLFSFDLNTDRWSRVTIASSIPSRRYAQRAVWDAARDRMLVFGGYDGAYLNDLWEYRPRPTPTWTQLFPGGALPTPRFAGGLVLDAGRDRLVVFGGYRAVQNPTPPPPNLPVVLNDLWTLPLSGPGAMTWQEQRPSGTLPSPRWGQVMLMDGYRDRAIVFGGGESVEATTADLFALDLAADPPAWSALPTPTSPPGRVIHAGVIDTGRDVLVIFGGFTSGPPARFLNDTWVYPLSGALAGWFEKSPTIPTPSARDAIGAIYDPIRRRTIVPTGFNGAEGYLSDTWALVWDGSVPAQASLVGAYAEPGRVRLDWFVRDAAGMTSAVERRDPGGAWQFLGAASPSGIDRLSYDDRSVVAGSQYGYRLVLRGNGESFTTYEVLVSVPTGHRLELAGAWPNPSTADRLTIALSLAKRGFARLELMDVAGRRVAAKDLSDLEPGQHRISFAEPKRFEPGVYVIRLAAEGRVLTAKAMVVR